MRMIRIALAAALALAVADHVAAQIGKSPIRIVIPYPAGGVGDTAARMIANSMRTRLNRTVIVENKPGAAGRLGIQSVKDAPADGSVLLFTPIAPMALFPHVYDNLAYDPVRDFQPISQVGTFDLGVAVGANVPAKNLKELVDWLKTHPDQAAYGTPAAGSLPHFFAVLFARHAGMDLRHVAYKGNPQAITDLIGGHLPMHFTSTQDLVEAAQGRAYPCPCDIGPGAIDGAARGADVYGKRLRHPRRGLVWHLCPGQNARRGRCAIEPGCRRSCAHGRIQQAADAARRPDHRHVGRGIFKDSEVRFRTVGAGGQGFRLQAGVVRQPHAKQFAGLLIDAHRCAGWAKER